MSGRRYVLGSHRPQGEYVPYAARLRHKAHFPGRLAGCVDIIDAFLPTCRGNRHIAKKASIISAPRLFHQHRSRPLAFPAARFRLACDSDRSYPWGSLRFTWGLVGYNGHTSQTAQTRFLGRMQEAPSGCRKDSGRNHNHHSFGGTRDGKKSWYSDRATSCSNGHWVSRRRSCQGSASHHCRHSFGRRHSMRRLPRRRRAE